jgi:hypothetical protein
LLVVGNPRGLLLSLAAGDLLESPEASIFC